MSLIEIPQEPDKSPDEIVALTIKVGVNDEHAHDLRVHINLWETLWENPRATPSQIFAQLGPYGRTVLLAGGAQVAHLDASAQIAGKTLEDILPAKYHTTALPVTVHQDGSVTIDE